MGKVEAIKAAMERYSGTLTGNSKAEFDEAKPHLVGLLDQNTSGYVVHLDANGSAYTDSEGKRIGQCSVTLKQIGVLCE
jgi:hypothetical protein